MRTYKHTDIHTYLHTYIHTLHTCIHTCMHTYIHVYMYLSKSPPCLVILYHIMLYPLAFQWTIKDIFCWRGSSTCLPHLKHHTTNYRETTHSCRNEFSYIFFLNLASIWINQGNQVITRPKPRCLSQHLTFAVRVDVMSAQGSTFCLAKQKLPTTAGMWTWMWTARSKKTW